MGRNAVKVEKPTRTDYKVVKKCVECEKEIPVACKTCPLCKKSQVPTAKITKQEDSERDPHNKVRRTERVRRERPDFFNSLEVETKFKKRRRRKESAAETVSSNSSKTSSDAGENPKKKRGRPKGWSQSEVEKAAPETPPEEDYYAHLPEDKLLQYQVILSEINRKISTQSFKPI